MLNKIDQGFLKGLIERDLISRERAQSVLLEVSSSQLSLLDFLVSKQALREEDGLAVLAETLKLERADLADFSVNQQILEKVPVKIASYYRFFPLALYERQLTIAVSYPFDLKTEDEIRMQLGLDLKYVLSRQQDILKALQAHYGVGTETIRDILSRSSSDEAAGVDASAPETKIEDIERQAQDASVIKLVNQILFEAYKKRATDIHIEPYRSKVRVRYRIDGVLFDVNVSPEIKRFLNAILSRIKIMTNLNIVERRLAQDGRAVVRTQDQVLDLRVSFIPTPYGESVVIRILPSQMLFSLERLGLSAEQRNIFEGLIARPHGIIFVTGPTGSGKTTSLYACLSKINTAQRKIITIEDPIEYEMEGITQIQVLPEINWTFAKGLRSMLRHDPDVMMVGEVRDLETAEIAIRVALTGHLVFSTLHTNDAASGITRLIDIGLEPYLVASSVEAFVAQRLVRLICSACKKELPPEADDAVLAEIRKQIAADLGLASVMEVRLYKGQGCPACNAMGFFGRTGIYEIILVDNIIRELIVKKAAAGQIKRIAVSRGMKTLRQDGWMKVIQGITSFDEVIKVTQAEEEVLGAPAAREQVQAQPQERPEGKRAYPRLDSRVNIRYKVFKSLDELPTGRWRPQNLSLTQNIGAGGVLFSSSDSLNIGAIVELKLELPDSVEAIGCLARVVRVEEIETDKNYHLAVQFLDISSSDKARINKFVTE